MKSVINLIRVHQWTKNFFIFTPAFFSGTLFDIAVLQEVLMGFFSFCFIASSIYIINDYVDIENDKLHPEKCKRPLASGQVKMNTAWILFVALLIAAVSLAWTISVWFLGIILFYFFMNIAYSFKLKQIAILDITIISIGFLLRVIAGGVVAAVVVSKWLFLMTFLLAMILAFAKRRDEFIILELGGSARKSIKGYNLNFIDISMAFLATTTFVCYIMYTISEEVVERLGSEYIYMSSFFVLIGLLRYFQLALVYKSTGSPTKVLYKDKVIQLTITAWIGFFAVLIYWL